MNKGALRQRIISLVLYLSLAFLIAYVLINKHSSTLKIGDLAPIDDQISLTQGTQSFRKLLKGPMVINFWASFCPPCRYEMPVLVKLAKKYQSRITFVGAASQSPKSDVSAIKKEFLIPFLLGHVDASVVEHWQAYTLPTTYLIDSLGVIHWVKAGMVNEAELDGAIARILHQ